MRRLALLAMLGAAMAAAPAHAQGPGPIPDGGPPMGPPMGPPAGPLANGAGFLLGHTGELKLTDAQVVRLAAIARRAEERRQTMRNGMSAQWQQGAQQQPQTPQARAEGMRRVQQGFEQFREQTRADLRDAIAVLTPDQQATAWEMVARGPAAGHPGQGGGMRRERALGMQGGRLPMPPGPDRDGPPPAPPAQDDTPN